MTEYITTSIKDSLYEIFGPTELTKFLTFSKIEDGIIEIFDTPFSILKMQKGLTKTERSRFEETAVRDTLKGTLLVFDTLSPSNISFLRRNKLNFVDKSGNMNLNIGKLNVSANNPDLNSKESGNNLMTEKSLMLILFLLSHEDSARMPIREIARRCGVSTGNTQRVLNILKKEKFIFETDNGRCLKQKEELLEIWVKGFNMIIKPKIKLGNAAIRNKQHWQDFILPEYACWGGEAAANLADNYLIPEKLSIFTNSDYRTTCIECGLIPIPSGDITIYRCFWGKDFSQNSTTPLLVIYAELMGMGDSRCTDAAKHLLRHENRID